MTKVLGDCAMGNLKDKYILKEIIGQGTFGTVRKCQHKDTSEVFAVKTVHKSKVPNLSLLQREIEILQKVHHPHIIHLEDVFEDSKTIHMVTELCTGGELYDRVVAKSASKEGHYSEFDAARILRNILEAIAYCHSHNITHRDLKPENFLLLHEGDDAPVKIIDFGLSRVADNVMKSRVGTVYYVAPEVLREDYTNKCDIWSIGVIAYVLLCGYPPFYADNECETLKLVVDGTDEVKFPSPGWDDITQDAKRFILRLLQRDPKLRPTAKEALEDPWLHRQEVQPGGLDRQASFSPHVSSKPSTPIRLKAQGQVSKFQRFLQGIKRKKAVKTPPQLL